MLGRFCLYPLFKGGSPGLVVIGADSCSRVLEFKLHCVFRFVLQENNFTEIIHSTMNRQKCK